MCVHINISYLVIFFRLHQTQVLNISPYARTKTVTITFMKILRDWMKHSTIYKSGLAKNVIKTQALDCLNCSFIFLVFQSCN